MKHPLIRTVIAILLGFFVLAFSGAIMMTISENTSLFKNLSFLEKTFQHTSMLLFSILFIILLSKGKLKEYGFIWNLNSPLTKVVLISLAFGLISSLVGKLFVNTTIKMPTDDFSSLEIILYIWFWASVCEEVFTRGLIQGFLTPLKHIGINIFRYYISLPVIVGAIFFGVMHFALLSFGVDIITVAIIVLFAIILGLIAGYQKEKTNSLIPAIIVHFCFNVGGSFLYIINIL